MVDVRPEKEELNRVRITAGGDRLDYYGETSTETSSSKTAKIVVNSVLSTKISNSCPLISPISASKQT